jgi:hypothetical protein
MFSFVFQPLHQRGESSPFVGGFMTLVPQFTVAISPHCGLYPFGKHGFVKNRKTLKKVLDLAVQGG